MVDGWNNGRQAEEQLLKFSHSLLCSSLLLCKVFAVPFLCTLRPVLQRSTFEKCVRYCMWPWPEVLCWDMMEIWAIAGTSSNSVLSCHHCLINSKLAAWHDWCPAAALSRGRSAHILNSKVIKNSHALYFQHRPNMQGFSSYSRRSSQTDSTIASETFHFTCLCIIYSRPRWRKQWDF
jgi:hypothetical protein